MSFLQKSLLGAGALSLLANLFFFKTVGTTGVAILVLLFHWFIVFTAKTKNTWSAETLVLEGSTLVFLGLSFFRATPSVQTVLLLAAILCTVAMAYLFHSGNTFFSSAKEILLLPIRSGRIIPLGDDRQIIFKISNDWNSAIEVDETSCNR